MCDMYECLNRVRVHGLPNRTFNVREAYCRKPPMCIWLAHKCLTKPGSLLGAAAGWLISCQRALVQAFSYIAWDWLCLVF